MLIRTLSIVGLLTVIACARTPTTSPDRADNQATSPTEQSGWSINPDGELNQFFECLETAGLSLISAHRGGAYPGYPENALETAQYVSSRIPALHEIDVATSRDGVLFLMHDDSLERTTNGEGIAKELDWRDIKNLSLEDKNGSLTKFSPPRLEDFLRWSKDRAIVQIDFKRSTRYEDVIALVRKIDVQDSVIYIAYTLAQAQKLHQLAPDAMVSVSVNSVSELNSVIAAGVPADRLIAFTGTADPSPRLFSFLNSQDVEVIFGTLGGRDALDKEIERTGDSSLYTDLSKQGVDIIATDRPLEAYKTLALTDRTPKDAACGITQVGRSE